MQGFCFLIAIRQFVDFQVFTILLSSRHNILPPQFCTRFVPLFGRSHCRQTKGPAHSQARNLCGRRNVLTLNTFIVVSLFTFNPGFMTNIEIYRSVLRRLSQLSVDYLQLVDNYLSSLQAKLDKKEENRNAVLALAGSWSDMNDEDFEDYLRVTKETGDELFNREVEL